MSFRILLIIIFVSFGCSSKDSSSKSASVVISKEVSTIVEKLAKCDIVQGNKVGYGGALKEQHLTFLKLLETASDEELTLLTDAENSTVRCYAIWGLYSRQTVNLETIMREHQRDSDSVFTMFGCTMAQETVGEFLADLVDDKKLPTKSDLGR